MTNIKKQEKKSEDYELSIQKFLARNACEIKAGGNVLWNEAILVKFFESFNFRKINWGNLTYYGQVEGNTVIRHTPSDMMSHFKGFLIFHDTKDIRRFLLENNVYFPPIILNTLKKEDMDYLISKYGSVLYKHRYSDENWTTFEDFEIS